jgi:protein tyrosine/serine phosphatase
MPKTLINLDEKTYRELKARALLENRSMAEIIREAIHVRFKTKPIDKRRLREYLREIVDQDREALDRLGKV